MPDGAIQLSWTRRARGAWEWLDGVDTPLVEQSEAYRVGIGPINDPLAIWETTTPELLITAQSLASLAPGSYGAPLWVRQIGNYGLSDALLLAVLN